jgi:hypothetical protein
MAKPPVILDNDTSMPIERLEALATQVQLIFPDSADEAMEEVVRLEEKKQLASVKQGLLLLQVKSQCSFGEFQTRVANSGISYRVAAQCISIAKMFLNLPDSKVNARSLLNMNHTQLREMAKLPIQVLDQLDEEAIEGLSDLSSRELAKEVKRLRVEKAEAEERAASAINQMNLAQLTKSTDVQGWPKLIGTIRQNALGQSSVASEFVEKAFVDVNELINARQFTPEQRLAAAQTVWHSWMAVEMRLNQMLQNLFGEFNSNLAGAEHLPAFSHQEWQNAIANREYMLAMYEMQRGFK